VRKEGKLIGVQKVQISKPENNTTNVTLDTLLREFKAFSINTLISPAPSPINPPTPQTSPSPRDSFLLNGWYRYYHIATLQRIIKGKITNRRPPSLCRPKPVDIEYKYAIMFRLDHEIKN